MESEGFIGTRDGTIWGPRTFAEGLGKNNRALTFFLENVPLKEGEDSPSSSPLIATQPVYFEALLSARVMLSATCWKVAAIPGRQRGSHRADQQRKR